jgi:hypothetical protein
MDLGFLHVWCVLLRRGAFAAPTAPPNVFQTVPLRGKLAANELNVWKPLRGPRSLPSLLLYGSKHEICNLLEAGSRISHEPLRGVLLTSKRHPLRGELWANLAPSYKCSGGPT